MDETPRFRITEKVLFGLALVALGAIFILDNLHLIYAGRLWDYWPVLMIVPGLARLLQPSRSGQRVWGAILVALGGVFLLRNLDIVWIPFHRVWPILLVVGGLYLIWQTTTRRSALATAVDGGSNPGARAFDGARAGLAATEGVSGPTTVEVFVMMGGVVFRVPEGWKVLVNVTPLLGGSDLKARTVPAPDGSVKTLVLNGFILMGG